MFPPFRLCSSTVWSEKCGPPTYVLRGKGDNSVQKGFRVITFSARECVRTTFFLSCVFVCVCAGRVPRGPRCDPLDRDAPWKRQQKTAVQPARRLTCRRHSAAPWPPSAAAPPSPRPRPRSERPCPLRPGSLEGQRQRHRRLWAGTRAHATGQPLRPPGGGGSPLGP